MDIKYLLWLQELRESAHPAIQGFFSFLGSDAATIVMMIVPCVVYWCLDKRVGQLAMYAYGLSSMCNQLVKNIVCRYRPWVLSRLVKPDPTAIGGATGYSFPSGHTQSSASALGALGWSYRDRRWPLVLGLLCAALIGFSRNFLGVHTPQDVAVGYLEGIAFVLLAERLLVWVDEAPGRDARLLVASLVGIAAFLAYVTVKPYPVEYVDGQLLVDPAEMVTDCYKVAGGYAGLVLGWVSERRYVGFSTEGLSVREGFARVAVGIVVVIVAYLPLGHALVALLGDYAGQFVRHLLAFVAASAAVPALFAPVARSFEARR